jgi:flagellar hook-associated protein 1 FlgK
LQGFFNGVQQVAANPSLLSARQAMISSAQTLSSQFRLIESRLDELSNDVNGRIQDSVSSINSYAEQIAALNQRIVMAESAYGQPANDMRDQRGQLINELNQLVKVSSATNSNGSLSLFVGSGQPLVIGAQAMKLTAQPSNVDPTKIVVGYQAGGGNSIELPENLIVGGELGGLIRFRSETLGRTENELGRIAASIALTFNAQNAAGQDLLGQVAGDTGFTADFFSMASLKPTVVANAGNTGAATISAAFAPASFSGTDGNFYTKLTTSDYRLDNTASGYTLTRLNDSKQWSNTDLSALSAQVANEDGFSFSLTGTDVVGNSYLIQPTKNAAQNITVNAIIASDPRTIAAALPFRTSAAASNTGTGAISGGTGAPGFDGALLPAGGIGVSFVSGNPAQLNLSGLTAGQVITYKAPGGSEQTLTVPAVVAPATSTLSTINYTQGMTISVSGMSFAMTGIPNNGDTFKLERNTAATADGRNALALGKLQIQNTVAGGKATFQTSYAETVANIGIKTRELKSIGAAQESALIQAQAGRDALSGVNLDEEAANMIRFQQAYQASAKILDIGSKLFESILQLG